MPSIVIRQPDIGGWLPSIHHAQVNSIRVLRGQNFRWDYNGPYSGFGSVHVSEPITWSHDLPYYQTFEFLDIVALCTPYGIYTGTCDNGWECQLKLDPMVWKDCRDNDYPWSMAFVGDSYFFSHPTVGIVSYNVFTCKWKRVVISCQNSDKENEALLYDFENHMADIGPVYGISQANNRLVFLLKDTFGWSEIDNGCNLSCDPFCGGGFVSNSLARYGRPLGIYETQIGFIVMTSNGLISARELNDIAAFKINPISYSMFPINPHAIVKYEDFNVLFLSKQGLKAVGLDTRGSLQITDFEKDVAGWIVEKQLKRKAWLDNPHSIKLFMSEETRELFISFQADHGKLIQRNLYNRSLVYNLKYQKWSSFDLAHYFIGPVNYNQHREVDFNLGFIGQDCRLNWFNGGGSVAVARRILELDSYIEVGPFEYLTEQHINQFSRIDKIALYVEGNQFMFDLDNSLLTTEREDNWGDLRLDFNANVQVSSGFDTYSSTQDNAYIEPSPMLEYSNFIKTYTCDSTGLYHTIMLQTTDLQGYYMLNRIDVQLSDNGTTAF